MVAWLAVLVAQISGLWHVAGQLLTGAAGTAPPAGSATPTGLVIIAAVAVAAVIVAALARGGRAAVLLMDRPLTGRTRAQRRKSLSAAFQRQLNPDAPGRVRPRAPSPALAAA